VALPGDVSTCTVTFGPYLDATGIPQFVGMTGTITPSWPVTDLSSGAVLTDAAVTVTIDSTGSASVTVPHTDQATLYPPNFTYSAAWTRGRHSATPSVRKFALPVSAGNSADFDRMTQAITAAGASVFLPIVVSVNGHTGAVKDSDLGIGAAFVIHGTNASAPRPATTLPVIWYGTVNPIHADDALDVWIPVSSDGGADSLASLQAALAAKADLASGVVPDSELPARLQDVALRAAFDAAGAAAAAQTAAQSYAAGAAAGLALVFGA
jgi:hypothetical protein